MTLPHFRITAPLAALIALALLASGCEGSPFPGNGGVRGEDAPLAQDKPSPDEAKGTGHSADRDGETSGSPDDTAPAAPKPAVPPPAEATLVAVGDVMMHTPQLPGAYDEAKGAYDFSGFFVPVKSVIESADWAVANLETPIGGDERGFKGYPLFNAPVALADALKGAGFDVLSVANNHALDQGFRGLAHTLETLRSRELVPIGAYDSEEAARSVALLEKNGIVQAFLSYTYGTNGIPVPTDKPYAVNIIEDGRIRDDIAKARKAGADVVSVSLHFGNEYQREPSEEQKRLARLCVDAGADVVIGHHPHVVQPYEWREVEREDGAKRRGLIMYSLGNFISNQSGDYKDYGAMLRVTFRKTHAADGAASTEIAEVDAIPTWVHKYVSDGKKRYRVISLDALEAGADPLLTDRLLATLHDAAADMNEHLESMAVATNPPPSDAPVTPVSSR